MKNPVVIAAIIIVLLIGGIGIAIVRGRTGTMTESGSMSKTSVVKQDDAMMKKTDNAMENADGSDQVEGEKSMMVQDSRYISYSPEAFAERAKIRRVLFFFANWCPTCRPADANFTKEMAQIPADVTLFRVNYNDTETDAAEKELAQTYGITYQHTYVQIDTDGAVVTKWNGGQIAELLTNIK